MNVKIKKILYMVGFILVVGLATVLSNRGDDTVSPVGKWEITDIYFSHEHSDFKGMTEAQRTLAFEELDRLRAEILGTDVIIEFFKDGSGLEAGTDAQGRPVRETFTWSTENGLLWRSNVRDVVGYKVQGSRLTLTIDNYGSRVIFRKVN
jgi:hypothetical protein